MRRATLTAVGVSLLLGAAAQAAPSAPPPIDPKVVGEMAQDAARFAEAVRGYRDGANTIIRREYTLRVRSIKGKYEPLIALNEKEEREKRMDAIAMLEAFLRKYPSDKRWTPDVMFRLAELYYEKTQDEFLTVNEAYQKALDSPNPPTTPPPKPDYTQTIDLYKRLLTEFPNYRLLDAAYYLLGYCLGEMGKDPEAKQALLALTCGNRYKPLDPPPPANPKAATESTRGPLVDQYKGCEPIKKDSKFVPEAWTRIGEMHFDGGELPLAISAYQRVLDYKDSSYYDKALYKLAWSYYRDNRFPEAIKEFDNLVKYADEKKKAGDKFGSDLRPEAVQYLGISFSEPDWDGDTLPDTETGLQRIDRFYRGRENEPHVKEVYQKLADIYFDQTKYAEAIAIYKSLLAKWPYFADAPKVQDKIVRSYERDRNMVQAAKERELLGRNYSKGGEWYNANRDNPEALAAAQQLAEDALLTAATTVHAQAQACRTAYLQNKDPKKLADCQAMYRTAGELYEKYLAAYPNSKKAYEFSLYYADAYYYGGKLPEAIAAYTIVRDSNLDNKYQVQAAEQIIHIYEEMIGNMKATRQLDEPPLPDESNTKPPVQAMAIPEVYKRYVDALDWYTTNIKDPKVPDMQYASATVFLRYHDWDKARQRLGGLTTAYCGTKPEVGFQAYDALIKTYFIDYAIQDEELKDCALGKLLTVVEQFGESPCSKSPKARDFNDRIATIRRSVKSSVIARAAQGAIQAEDTGVAKGIPQCKDGTGGIAIVTGVAPIPKADGKAAPSAPGDNKQLKIDTTGQGGLDESLALALMDLVNENPKDPDAPVNLNNACVIYERLFKYGQATKCYEGLAKNYPDAPLAKDALWNAARNHSRFFEFDRAVGIYQTIATDPKFASYEHRTEALGLAAMLLNNDQQYPRAADFYKRYADAKAPSPKDSSQAYTFACTAYEKMKDTNKERACLNDLIRRYSSQPAAGDDVVNAYLKLAQLAEATGNKKATVDAYNKVRSEFVSRHLAAATPAAAAAAKAEYLLTEDKFNAFKAKTFPTDVKQLKKSFEKFTAEARALSDDYRRIWDYKDATWTLAAFLRMGDIYYEFSRKLVFLAENPPADVKALMKKAERISPGAGETEVLGPYKDEIYKYVTPLEDEAKKQWKGTLERAAQLGVTNDYVKRARENLSKYDPDNYPFVKDERIGVEYP